MPVLGYCRVSTDEQVLGCQVQEDMILDTCARLHLGEPVIIWDDGVSTSEVPFNERPGIVRLLRCLRADDHLVVWRLDRIERGFLTFYDALRQIVERDVWIHSIEEKGGQAIDLNTAQGRAFVAVLQIGCDMYRETVDRYEWYRRAARWFHRAKHNGELPPPYRDLAGTIPEPKGFTLSKRPKKKRAPTVLPAGIERVDWTAEDWLRWYANQNGNGHPEGSIHG